MKFQELFGNILDSGKAASTLKVYVVTISAYHVPINSSLIGSHTLICSFLKGVRQLRPACNPHFPGWDLPLELVCLPPFNHLQAADHKWVSLKKAYFVGHHFC